MHNIVVNWELITGLLADTIIDQIVLRLKLLRTPDGSPKCHRI